VHLEVRLTSGCGTVMLAHLLQIVVAGLPVVAAASLVLVGLVGIWLLLLMLIRTHLGRSSVSMNSMICVENSKNYLSNVQYSY